MQTHSDLGSMHDLYEQTVLKAGRIMLDKLIENEHKGHWEFDNPDVIFLRVCEEFGELNRAYDAWIADYKAGVNQPFDAHHLPILRGEGADVMNMLMMFLDLTGALPEYADLPTPKNRQVDHDREEVMVIHADEEGSVNIPDVLMIVRNTIERLKESSGALRITIEKI